MCINFLVFQKKLLQNLHPFWFYVVLNIAFLKETKVCMENSVIFGRFLFFSNFPYFKQNSIIQYNHINNNASS